MQVIKIASRLAESEQMHYLRNRYTSRIAFIDEENCIGCTKCIDRCPADAIIGAKRQLHTIISHYCTGCHLCTQACPTDCIDMKPAIHAISPQNAKLRYQTHFARLFHISREKQAQNAISVPSTPIVEVDPRKQAIADAIARAKLKKQQLQQKYQSDHRHESE